jgi:hypothetical protein
VCNVLPEPVWDDWHVLCRRILLWSRQQPKWIVLAVRDGKKLNSGVRVRWVVKSTELVKFKLAPFQKIKS